MVTTRRGTNTTSKLTATETPHSPDATNKGATPRGKKRAEKRTNKGLGVVQNDNEGEEPPKKKAKLEDTEKTDYKNKYQQVEKETELDNTGTIERGHIYFFYRPRVDYEQASSLDDVARFQMLLVPRPPALKSTSAPAEAFETAKKRHRLISIGKKSLPDPGHGGHGHGRKDAFWATVTAVGDDIEALNKGLGGKTYETKTKGTRHQDPSRLAGRGAYAIVNNNPRVPSERTTHLGYHLSHPSESELGEVQKALGIQSAAAFVIQVKNPLAPTTSNQVVGRKPETRAKYPEEIMKEVFGMGGSKGREDYGLKFSSIETTELLDYEGAELLLIASVAGEAGVEEKLGEGRGEELRRVEKDEEGETIDKVLRELGTDQSSFLTEPLEGQWI